ncbi:ABC transporter permease [Aneurinibacillus migulanus]|uniref:ABC transporter permease n=1 Tax=Aneurinibacillus migulanus TaxID=47500 RepID=UPI0006A1556D|nr:ABC transporter permease [Aneurinibacillus migulanus]CEH29164.1 Uncharacterized protein BN1090_A2_01590 [Aneurinibacillus migulanus]
MIKKLILSDRVKMKRTPLKWVVLLIPMVVLAYEIVNFSYRSAYIKQQMNVFHADTMWSYLIWDNSFLLGLGVPLGITLAASIIANVEHQANSWKQTLSMPISRIQVYVSKFIWLFGSSIISALIFSISMVAIGKILNFESDIPWRDVWGDSLSVYLTAIPFMSVQLWISMLIKNQAFSITIGSVSTMMGLFMAMNQTTRWLPWAFPVQASTIMLGESGLTNNLELSAFLVLSFMQGFVILLAGAIHFAKKDVQ